MLADCDVDAADLHLLLSPRLREEHEFWSGVEAEIDATRCTGCGTCAEICHFSAIELNDSATIRPFSCEGCGVCINKWDLHPGVSAEIGLVCQERGLELLGSIPYDRAAMDAVVHGRPVTLHAPHSLASRAIHELGERLLAD